MRVIPQSQGFVGDGRRSIHYRAVRGRGPAVLLVHGMGATSAVWDEVLDVLAGQADLVAIDLHGVGGTSVWSGSRRMGLEDEAELVLTVGMELFGERPFHLIGHGYGGAVALCAAVLAPEALASVSTYDVLSLALLERIEPDGDALPVIRAQRERFDKRMQGGDALDAMAGWASHYLGPEAWPALDKSDRRALTDLAGATAEQWLALASDRTTVADLRSLRVPLLIMCGGKTRPSESRLSQLLHGHAPIGRFDLLAGVGHDAPWVNPTMLAGAWSRHWIVGSPQRAGAREVAA